MKELSFRIPISFGDNSMLKSYMDQIADGYDTINICHHLWYVEKEKNNNPKYYQFCKDIGNLYFSSPPYKYDNKDNRDFPYIDQETFIEKFNLSPNLPNLQFYLCRGEYPIISEPYIVLPTKIRYLHRTIYNQIYDEFWDSNKHLSKKYKIVI